MTKTAKQPERAVETEGVDKLGKWIQANQRRLAIGAVAAFAIAAGVWFTASAKARREAFAQRELDQARIAAESGNLALAANDLTRLVDSYGGTPAADEAVLVLGQVRLMQGQPAVAVAELRDYIDAGPREHYRVQAHALLGTALEQTGQMLAAAEAYLRGVEERSDDLLRAGLLIDAGRAFLAGGDTARAAAAYERVLTDFENAPRASEARLRLGELGRFDTPS